MNYNQNLNNLKEKIQQLINKSVEENNYHKTLLNFLFKKLEEVKEMETLERLKEFENGKYLKAYLFYQSIKRANYQPEHLKLTHLENIDKCLEMIEKDIECNLDCFGKQSIANRPKEELPKELSNQQLLIMLGGRIGTGEIKVDKGVEYIYTGTEEIQQEIKVSLKDGKIEPDPAKEFLKKHGISKK